MDHHQRYQNLSMHTSRDGEIDALRHTQGFIIHHVRNLDSRVTHLESCKRRRQRSLSVSMIIDWRMIVALVVLIMGMLGLIQVDQIKSLGDLTLTLK